MSSPLVCFDYLRKAPQTKNDTARCSARRHVQYATPRLKKHLANVFTAEKFFTGIGYIGRAFARSRGRPVFSMQNADAPARKGDPGMTNDFSSGVWDSRRIGRLCAALGRRYPFLTHGSIGRSVMGRPLHVLTLGSGPHRVLVSAAHHANEWITAPLLLRFVCELSAAAACDRRLAGEDVRALLRRATLSVVPAVNPDGIDLVTGALRRSPYAATARRIAAAAPALPFPAGWKANIAGVDLNLQYPAGWELAKSKKLPIAAPAPRDYVGPAPLCAPEARALADYTVRYSPALTLAYHSQGREIYWDYQGFAPPGAAARAAVFARLSGYAAVRTPADAAFAGYKDWFLDRFRRPGFTIEVGSGTNPLPPAQLDGIYGENLGLLLYALRPAPDLSCRPAEISFFLDIDLPCRYNVVINEILSMLSFIFTKYTRGGNQNEESSGTDSCALHGRGALRLRQRQEGRGIHPGGHGHRGRRRGGHRARRHPDRRDLRVRLHDL
jgi:g-D-glutamyl-meso-diaminopimelate peptidase